MIGSSVRVLMVNGAVLHHARSGAHLSTPTQSLHKGGVFAAW